MKRDKGERIEKICRDCRGIGKIFHLTCQRCNGTGRTKYTQHDIANFKNSFFNRNIQ